MQQQDLGTQIPKIKNLTEEVIINLIGWWKLLNTRAAVEKSRIKRLEIEDHVKRRYRIFEQDGVDRNLITKEEAVLERTMLHFQQQFRKRRTHLSSMSNEWSRIYKPLEKIKESWYMELESEISLEEWFSALKETKNTSAPGPSGIEYRLIKQASISSQEIFRQLANKCLIE
ncbi:12250_t:CDS:2, partial [Gigaspora rosea]